MLKIKIDRSPKKDPRLLSDHHNKNDKLIIEVGDLKLSASSASLRFV
jgi:hypothetical protein